MKKPQKIEMDTEEIRKKLIEQLKPTGWYELLRGFLLNDEFLDIISYLKDEVEEGNRFTPTLKQVFRPFIECTLQDAKVILIGDSPYPQLGVADGLAFSCRDGEIRESDLRYIQGAISKTVYDNKEIEPVKDLKHWAAQGVLLLNYAFTTKIDRYSSHHKLWNPFMTYLIDMLSNGDHIKVAMLMGRSAHEMEDLFSENVKVFTSLHPSSAEYAELKQWDCNDIFNKVNSELESKKLLQIKW